MTHRSSSAGLFLAALLLPGCSLYGVNRARDLADPFGLGFGVGLGASARATHFLQAGLCGNFTLEGQPGFLGRRNMKDLSAPYGEAGIAPLAYARGTSYHGRTILLGRTRISRPAKPPDEAVYWTWFPSPRAHDEGYDRRLLDLGVSAYFMWGFDLAISPFEVLDLFLGLFGLDIAGDDAQTDRSSPI